MKKLLFGLSFVAVFAMLTTGAWATNGGVVKWSQPPDMAFGVNIQSTEVEPIVADDWKCEDPRPVTDVHFWGSYIGWERLNSDPQSDPPRVEVFLIRIYQDIPAGVDPKYPYSHPGDLLYEEELDSFNQEYVAAIEHPDVYEHKFSYSLDLPEPFVQEEGTIYWISIAAIMPQNYEFPWGWETSNIHWNDDACKYDYIEQMWVKITPDMLPEWYREHYETVDMAFELTVQSSPPPLEPIKWQQRPDMVQGVNIISIPIMPSQKPVQQWASVADDWFCLDGSPVSDLHFWGSYPDWQVQQPDPTDDPPGVEAFRIQVYSDVPIGPTEYSHPGKLLYEVWVQEGDFTETYVASIPLPWEVFEHKYKYDLDLPRIFWQERDRIYWLNISAIPCQWEFPWGWENSMDRWNDFAVEGWYFGPDDWRWWLTCHPWTKEPVDMSFELTTCEGPIKWLQFPDMANGINILSLPDNPVVADDWLCTDGKPITEVHFWGSYLSREGEHWEQGNPVPSNTTPGVEKFKLSFHKDIPAGVDPNMHWSHPGEKVIDDVWVDFDNVEERYWDSVPHFIGPQDLVWWEHKYYYIVKLEDEPFQQEEGKVYWLDIGAVPRGPEPTWYWGWETSKDHWNDNAVRGDGTWWDDLGQFYPSPIDMAFLLITPDDTDYCEGDFDRDGDVDGSDLAVFAADYNRTNCYNNGDCEGDFDYDGDVDTPNLAVFAADYGRTDCSCALPFGPMD